MVDPASPWILSGIVPTVLRGHRFVCYSTTCGHVCSKTCCCCRQPEKYSDPLLLYMSKKNINTALLVYDTYSPIIRTQCFHVQAVIGTKSGDTIHSTAVWPIFFFITTLTYQLNSREILHSAIFWTSRGHRCRRFSPTVLASIFIAYKVHRSPCSSIFIECC